MSVLVRLVGALVAVVVAFGVLAACDTATRSDNRVPQAVTSGSVPASTVSVPPVREVVTAATVAPAVTTPKLAPVESSPAQVTTVPVIVEPAPPVVIDPVPPVVSLLPEPVVAARAELAELGVTDTDQVIVVDPASQTLFLTSGSEVFQQHQVSTGSAGLSGRWESGGTPTGALRVSSVRSGEMGEVFKFAQPTGRIARISDAASGSAYMTTRVLVLEGMEPHNESSLGRGIYVHGTNLEGSLGTPRSAGCVRISNNAAIELAAAVTSGTWMYILDRPFVR